MIGVPPAGAQRLVNWGVSAGKGHQIPFALLDSPVLGSLAEATAGTLTLLVGGPADVLDRCGLVLSPLGEVRHVGALGSGAAAKLVANFALLGSVTLLGEALALADALGIDRDAAWDLLETTPLAAQAGRRRPAIEDGSYPPRFPLRLASKDAELIGSSGLGLRIGRVLAGWFADAAADGCADLDYTAVLGYVIAAGRSAGDAA
jgi:3-hydroxyisobutyrate dehydrogenase-like beta-hydroxyacid dehydrogenase